jgi:hypothetical protein
LPDPPRTFNKQIEDGLIVPRHEISLRFFRLLLTESGFP